MEDAMHPSSMKPHNRKLLLYDDISDTIHSPPPLSQLQPMMITTVQNGTTSSLPPSLNTSKTPPLTSTSFDSSMALTFLFLLTAIFFMGFFSIYIRRISAQNSTDYMSQPHRRRRRRRDRGSHSPSPSSPVPYYLQSIVASQRGLDPATVRSLPVYSYRGGAKYQIECLICLGEFEERESVKTIPFCGHVFHLQCIDTWLASHVTCPVCRGTQLFKAGKIGRVCSSVVQQKCDEGASAVDSGSTPVNGDTCTEVMAAGTSGVRRSRSCSKLGERVSLQRTFSY